MFDKIIAFFKNESEDPMTSESIFADSENENINTDSNDKKNYYLGKNNTEKIEKMDIEKSKLFKKWFKTLPNFDPNKDSILIVDDNPGIISFLLDDLEEIGGLDDYNIITFDTNYAAYQFEATQQGYGGLNIKYALIDLTLGGTLPTDNGPIKYTGVDIFQQITIFNPEVKVLFYTGNSLNEYVRTSKAMIDQFKELTGKDIKDFVLFKTSLDLNSRREFLKEWFKK